MNLNNDPIDKYLQNLMQEMREEAPKGFSDNIMQALPRQQARLPRQLFRPLLSRRAVAFTVFLLLGLGWVSSLFNSAAPETVTWLPDYQLPSITVSFSLTLTDITLLTIILTASCMLAALDHFLKRKLGSR